MEIPMDSLRKLPADAGYSAKSGRTGVTVRFRRDTVTVEVESDSLQRLCTYYENTATAYKAKCEGLQSLVQEEKEQRFNPVRTALISFLVGVIIGILLTIIVKLKIKTI